MTGEDKEQGPQKKEQKLTIRPAHGRQKLPHHPVVGKVVDVEGEAHVALAGVEERAADDDAGVVDEDGRVADAGAHLAGHGGDGLGRGDIAMEVVDVGAYFKGHGLDVQHDNFHPPLGQQLDHMAADAAGAARDEHDLLGPVVAVGGPVVQHLVREPVVGDAQGAEPEQRLEPREGRRVQDAQVLALLGVPREQDQRQEERRVEGRVADEPDDRVHLEPLAWEEAVVHRHLGMSP